MEKVTGINADFNNLGLKEPPNEFFHWGAGRTPPRGPGTKPLATPASSTYRQVLWGESAQACQVPPGGSVELLHLLRQLLLEAPLLFVLLSVRELDYDGRGAALWSDTAESEEGVTAWLKPLVTLSTGSTFLNYLGAHGTVWKGFKTV